MGNVFVHCLLCPADAPSVPAEMLTKHQNLAHGENVPIHNDVQFYSEHAQKLQHGQRNKVIKFLQNKCIEYAGAGVYVCKPIAAYNKTTYKITKGDDGEFHCTCQYNTLNKLMCSHIVTLYEFFARGQRYEN